MEALEGGITASVWRCRFVDRPALVLKYFDDEAFVAERPDRSVHEAAVLDLLATGEVPVPVHVAHDEDGSIAGAPAVLMTAVEGSRLVPVPDPGPVATILAAIHRTTPSVPWQFERYNPIGTAGVPAWGDGALWSEAVAAIGAPGPETPRCFIHRDFHHHNLVWSGSSVAAVVDWLSACVGPPGIDIARFRLNTLFDGHPQVGDAFAAGYRSVGVDGAEHAFWDLVDAVDLLPWYSGDESAVAAWPGEDADPGFRDLIEEWIRRALEAL